MDEHFDVALHPEIEHVLDSLGSVGHDLQKFVMFVSHHILQLNPLSLSIRELL